MSQLLTYATYHSPEETKNLTAILEGAGIPYEVEYNRDILDKVYIGDNLDPMIAVKISPSEFERVNDLCKAEAKNNIHEINPDYYLFQFENDELINVVKNKNEWNAFDQGLAEKILFDRNVTIEHTTVVHTGAADYTPLQVKGIYLALQYLVSFVWPYAGILIGVATNAAYRTLSNGSRVKMYDEYTRTHGRIMLVIGIVRTLVMLFTFYPMWFNFY